LLRCINDKQNEPCLLNQLKADFWHILAACQLSVEVRMPNARKSTLKSLIQFTGALRSAFTLASLKRAL
jgi:hypothetical protein